MKIKVSLNVTKINKLIDELVEVQKQQEEKTYLMGKSKKGETYLSAMIFVNDKVDQFKNDVAIKVFGKDENINEFIGNGKKIKS